MGTAAYLESIESLGLLHLVCWLRSVVVFLVLLIRGCVKLPIGDDHMEVDRSRSCAVRAGTLQPCWRGQAQTGGTEVQRYAKLWQLVRQLVPQLAAVFLRFCFQTTLPIP